MCERNINWLPLKCPQLGAWSTTQASVLTGNITSDFSVCRMMPNPLSYTSQDPLECFWIHLYYIPENTKILYTGSSSASTTGDSRSTAGKLATSIKFLPFVSTKGVELIHFLVLGLTRWSSFSHHIDTLPVSHCQLVFTKTIPLLPLWGSFPLKHVPCVFGSSFHAIRIGKC